MIVGIIIITSPANSAPQSVAYFCTSNKFAIPMGRVFFASSVRRTSANGYSFQKPMALNIVMVAIPGFARGTITLDSSWILVAPSILADSS